MMGDAPPVQYAYLTYKVTWCFVPDEPQQMQNTSIVMQLLAVKLSNCFLVSATGNDCDNTAIPVPKYDFADIITYKFAVQGQITDWHFYW
jgi:hypothetical protein